MAADLVNAATSENLKEVDWGRNIQICELVAHQHGKGKDVIKSVKKRLRSKNPNVQLFSVMLLEMLLNNCGEHIHMQVIDNGLLPLLVKTVKKKNKMPVEERIFLLLDAVQTLMGGESGKFPQYHAAYYDLVSAGVKFPQRSHMVPANLHAASNANAINSSIPETPSTKSGSQKKSATKDSPDYCIIQKATSVLEVLCEVLDAQQHPELVQATNDEFTLDLVEQCSFQKQQIMHIVMNSRDENVVSQSIELNEKLHEALAKHKAIVSSNSTSGAPIMNQTGVDEEEEEDDLDSLLHRIRKGKACVNENSQVSPVSIRQSHPRETPQQASTQAQPLCIKPLGMNGSSNGVPPVSIRQSHPREAPQQASTQAQPLCIKPLGMNGSSNGVPASSAHVPIQSKALPFSIPPPPSKHRERERFFMEKQIYDGSSLARHMNGVSLHGHNGSSSLSGSGSALQG